MRKYLYILLLSLYASGLSAQTYYSRMATAIDIGTYSDFFTYSDTKNTGDYTDGYTHRFYDPTTDGYYTEPPARDVFYKLTITGKSMQLQINDASSFVYGTRIYILDAAGNELAYCKPYDLPYPPFLYSVQPGTYYIVIEAATDDWAVDDVGTITIGIDAVAKPIGDDFFYPAVLGTFSADFNASHIINIQETNTYIEDYTCDFKDGSEMDDDPYRHDLVQQFTITKPMDITLDNIGSNRIESMNTLYLHLLSSSKDTIPEESIENRNQTTQKIHYELDPGTYYVYSKFTMENYTDAKYALNITGKEQLVGSVLSNPINVGSKSANFTYSHTQNTGLFSKSRVSAKPGKEVFYQFTLTVPMEITMDNCGSAVADTYLELLSEDQQLLYSNDTYTGTGACANTQNAYIKVPALLPGTYYVVSDGALDGNITTTIKGTTIGPMGDRMSTAIDAGIHDAGFHFTDTKNTASAFSNQFSGKSTNDVFYQFTLSHPMDIAVSHCGSAVTDTYMNLLDESGTVIYSNDNYTGEEQCSNTGNALIKVEQLPAGTYYVVSEGNTQNGNITTTIEANSAFGNINTTRGQPHIISIVPTVETDSLETLDADSLQRSVQYFDHFGYPTVHVQLDFAPLGGDLVTLQETDGFFRKSKDWLPIAKTTEGGQYVTPQQIQTAAKAMANDQRPYSQTLYDGSPLDLVVEQYGPGDDWFNNDRSVKTDRMANSGTSGVLACARYALSGTAATPTFTKTGFYADNELYVTRTTDEDNNIRYEFKDKAGRLVLSRQMSDTLRHDTYYIYDDYGNLSFVLPPLAADALTASNTTWNESTAVVKNYAYVYRYDGRGRCIWKKLPGCDPVYSIYDSADRLIFMQDGEQRAKATPEWTFTVPDAYGRTALTGRCTNSLAYQSDPLANVLVKASYTGGTNAMKGYTVSGVTLAGPEILSVNYYDGYTFVNTNGIAGDVEADIVLDAYEDAYVAATGSITLQDGFHVPAGSNFHAVITGSSTTDSSETGFGTPYLNVKGQLTGTLAAQLNADGTIGSTYLYSVMYYDNRGRLIQTDSNNQLPGGTEKEYVAYNFAGQPVKRKHIHAATGRNTQTEVYTYTYDQMGRPIKTTHQLTDGTTVKPQVTLAENSYDELGRLQTVAKDGKAQLTTAYAYNIRSWMKSITNPLFSETLYYNETYGGSTGRYNGNISAMSWKHADESATRGYAFSYDPLSRLTAAAYLQNATASNNYKTAYTYDKQGNMLTQQRYGLVNTTTYGLMDNLTMTLTGNQLTKVEDAAGTAGFKNYSNVATEYTYNKNGSMVKDLNKGISQTAYNSLNLPRQLDIKSPTAEARREYTYSADGEKLKVVQRWNPNYSATPVMGSAINAGSLTMTRTTDYVGNMVYEDGTLKRVLVEGGYYQDGMYYFYLRDHLGNNRVVADTNGVVAQKNHYYPFGATFAESTNRDEQPYLYNGKELDHMNGLEMYDYGARMYDPVLARWEAVDPLAENHFSVTGYNYVLNDPIGLIDPLGLDTIGAGKVDFHTFDTNEDVIGLREVTVTAMKPTTYENVIYGFANGIRSTASGIRNQFTGWGMLESSINGATFGIYGSIQMMEGTRRILVKLPYYTRADYEKGIGYVLEKALEAYALKHLSGLNVAAKTSTTALTKFYPANNGFLGATERTFLMPGQQISRFGSNSGKFFSPAGTPLPMRALPPGANTSIHNTFKVLKPFEVQAGKIAPAFGQPGLGTQYLSPVSVDVLLKRGIIGY